MKWNFKSNIKLKGVQILALGFIIVILVGAILLTLPISSVSGESTRFFRCIIHFNISSMCYWISCSGYRKLLEYVWTNGNYDS